MPVANYSTLPAANNSISGIDISEGCTPAGYNDALRQIMADIKAWTDSYVAPAYPITVANGGTGSGVQATALANLGAMPLAGGVITGPVTLSTDVAFGTKITRSGFGVVPHFASTSMTSGRIYVQAVGADPTVNPGDICLEY